MATCGPTAHRLLPGPQRIVNLSDRWDRQHIVDFLAERASGGSFPQVSYKGVIIRDNPSLVALGYQRVHDALTVVHDPEVADALTVAPATKVHAGPLSVRM